MEATIEPRGIHRRIQFEVTKALRARLNAKVDSSGGPEACWPWTGAPRNGYGAIKHEGKVLGTHVVAFLAAGGVLEDGQLVTHDCDNRLCCNPKHLVAGTATTNARECWDRRAVNATRGEAAPQAVMTEADIRLILAMRVVHGWGSVRIARAIGKNQETVKNIVARQNWKHVPMPTPEEAIAIVANFQQA